MTLPLYIPPKFVIGWGCVALMDHLAMFKWFWNR